MKLKDDENKRSIRFEASTMAELKKLSALRNVYVSDLVREFVKKGLAINSYQEDTDLIREIVREELKNVLEPQINRIVKMLMKIGKVSAGTMYSNLSVIQHIVASDPKGELFQYTCAFLRWLGYNVVVLDFNNPLKSDRYNLLQPIIDAIDDDNIPEATEYVWDLVSILVGEAKGEKIWNNGEASTIACAIMSVVYDNREGENRKYQTLTNVYYFIAEMCNLVGKKMPIVE